MKVLSDNIKPILALFIVASGFLYFFASTFFDVKPNDQIIIAIVGLMTGATGYYFGSNTGMGKKDETINNLTKSKNEL